VNTWLAGDTSVSGPFGVRSMKRAWAGLELGAPAVVRVTVSLGSQESSAVEMPQDWLT